MNREAIHAALFELLDGAYGFNSSARRIKHWDDVNSSDFPALFLVHKYDTVEYLSKGAPPKYKMLFDVVIYVNTDGDHSTPSVSLMNPIIDAMDSVFGSAPYPLGNDQTLGGLVCYCRMGGGNMQTDEGALGDIGVAIIPVEVLVPT